MNKFLRNVVTLCAFAAIFSPILETLGASEGCTEGGCNDENATHPFTNLVTNIQCRQTDDKVEHSVCKLSNVILFEGNVYVVDPEITQLPSIIMDYESNQLDAHIVRPHGLPFRWQDVQVDVIEEAYLMHHLFLGNFYHDFAEGAPTVHMSLCAHWGRCTMSTPVTLLTLHGLDQQVDDATAGHLQQVFRCFGGGPVQSIKNPTFKSKVHIVKTVFTGIGQHVRMFHNYNKPLEQRFNLSMPAEQAVSWRTRLSECLGKDFVNKKVPCPNLPLHITLVNRPYHKGRTLLNYVEVENLIAHWEEAKALWPGGIKVKHVYTDGLPLREQAHIFWKSHVVIWTHGAAMSNLIFLPQGAGALEIIPWPGAENYDRWASTLKDHLHLSIQYNSVTQQHNENVVPHMDYFQRTGEFQSQSESARLAFYEQLACPEGVGFTCTLPWRHWRTSYVMDWGQLADALRTTIQQVHAYAASQPQCSL